MSSTQKLPDDMQEAMQRLSKEAEAVVASFGDVMDAQPPPTTIYHYTNDAGLRGILESGKLWLTDIFNLNDPTELRHGLASALDIMKVESDKGKPEVNAFVKEISAVIGGGAGVGQMAHFFVCCFSLDGNDLGQWRAYADNGSGYAIGFDAHILEQAFVASGSLPTIGAITFPMTYDDDNLHEMQQQVISKIVSLISAPRGRNLADDVLNEYVSKLAENLIVILVRSSMVFKHKAYRNEREYRFLCVHQEGPISDIKYRARPNSLIRYREFDWRSVAAQSLKEIVIGPSADLRLALPFVRDCLRAFHQTAEPINIRQSDIPYRA